MSACATCGDVMAEVGPAGGTCLQGHWTARVDFIPNGNPADQGFHQNKVSLGTVDTLAPAPLGVRLADVQTERIVWLSRGRLAAGKMTIIDGDPGLGKSTVLLDWAARITTGRALPGGEPGKPKGVVILSAEDGIADTIRPRAEEAGADLTRVFVMTEMEDGALPSIPTYLGRIEHAIEAIDAALLIVDPLAAFLDGTVNMNRDQEVRRALMPLKQMGERTGVACALLRHLNKMVMANAMYRGGGSIGVIGGARFGLLFAFDPEDQTGARRLIAPIKANIGGKADTLSYTLVPVSGTDVARVEWGPESTMSANAILAAANDDERDAKSDAKAFLRDLLKDGPVAATDIKKQARENGIHERTLWRAKSDLGVVADKADGVMHGSWFWSMSSKSAKAAKTDHQSEAGLSDG